MTQTINMKPPTRAIGANVDYFWKSERVHGSPVEPMSGYISFGFFDDFDEFGAQDQYGVDDSEILYYATRREFPSLCTRHSAADFIVTEFSWEYR